MAALLQHAFSPSASARRNIAAILPYRLILNIQLITLLADGFQPRQTDLQLQLPHLCSMRAAQFFISSRSFPNCSRVLLFSASSLSATTHEGTPSKTWPLHPLPYRDLGRISIEELFPNRAQDASESSASSSTGAPISRKTSMHAASLAVELHAAQVLCLSKQRRMKSRFDLNARRSILTP